MTRGERPVVRGRPRDPAKQVALLDAARELFLQHGPEATMDEVVAHAKVSRTTLYANFPDKGALIEAMFARESRRLVSEAFAEEDAAASDLIGLWQGFRRVEQSFGQRPPYQGDELQRFVARCVGMFFRMYGAPTTG